MTKKRQLILIFTLSLCTLIYAQEKSEKQTLSNRVNILFGIGQLTQSGFNIEGNIFFKRLTFDYSHGISLDLSNNQLEKGADKKENLAIHIPWTTGFGIGYRFNDWLNIRAEPKWHKFELYYDTDKQIAGNLIGDYTTFTLGFGLYANILPFKNQNNFLKGIMVTPSIRWWPKVSSSLKNDEFSYYHKLTNLPTTHKARQIGMSNTSFFFNISVGYSLKF